jgi:rRNA processing protein Krr1/Pno1
VLARKIKNHLTKEQLLMILLGGGYIVVSDKTTTAGSVSPSSQAENPLSIKKATSLVEAITSGTKTPEECSLEAGISLVSLYEELKRLALSSENTAKDKYGDVVILGPDNKTRLAAIALLLELHKHIKDKNVVTQVGIFNDPRVVAEADRVLALRDRIK